MAKYTFRVKEDTGKYGNKYNILYAEEFPFVICQVIPLTDENRTKILEYLNRKEEFIVFAEGRTDFCVIQACGTTDGMKIVITRDNWREVDRAICECVQAAADFWAENGDKITGNGTWKSK